MPRIKPLSAAQERQKELSARIIDLMYRRNLKNDAIAEHLGISEKTFIDRKLHRPEDFSIGDIWKMEKLFGCRISDPLSRKEETA